MQCFCGRAAWNSLLSALHDVTDTNTSRNGPIRVYALRSCMSTIIVRHSWTLRIDWRPTNHILNMNLTTKVAQIRCLKHNRRCACRLTKYADNTDFERFVRRRLQERINACKTCGDSFTGQMCLVCSAKYYDERACMSVCRPMRVRSAGVSQKPHVQTSRNFIYLHFAWGVAEVKCTPWVKKGDTLTMAITLSILDPFAKFFHCCKLKSTQFQTKPILGYPPPLKYVAALPWKT